MEGSIDQAESNLRLVIAVLKFSINKIFKKDTYAHKFYKKTLLFYKSLINIEILNRKIP